MEEDGGDTPGCFRIGSCGCRDVRDTPGCGGRPERGGGRTGGAVAAGGELGRFQEHPEVVEN